LLTFFTGTLTAIGAENLAVHSISEDELSLKLIFNHHSYSTTIQEVATISEF
jgi:hypothetical protein